MGLQVLNRDVQIEKAWIVVRIIILDNCINN